MALRHVNPTRMELSRLKKRLAVAKRGHKLLKDKQDEMVRQFMLIVRKNDALRQEVETELSRLMKNFTSAKRKMSQAGVLEALMIPASDIHFEVDSKAIMNINTPTISFEEPKTVDLTYGFAFTPSELDDAVLALSGLLTKLVELAQIEKTCDMLAFEIEKTRRRVNAIEFVMIPEMTETIRYITMKLDDNERSNIIRLMKSKEIVLAKQQQS